MPSAPIISFEYQASAAVRLLALIISVSAGLGLWLSAVPAWGCMMLDGGLVAALLRYWLHERRRPTEAMIWLDDQRWLCAAGSVQESEWQLRQRWIWGSWIVLELGRGRRRRGLWLTASSLPADTMRRLRMRLALSGHRAEIQQRPLA